MEPFLGEIRVFGGNYPPVGWALCNGAILSIQENEPLFALIGTTYGGDGITTFALPDLRGRVPIHMGENPATRTNYVTGQKGGVEEVTLLTSQLPAHTHKVYATALDADSSIPSENVSASTELLTYADSTLAPIVSMSPQAVSSAGYSQVHENIMPSLCITFIISTQGVYPSLNN